MQIATAIDASTVAYKQGGYPNNRFVASAGANWNGVSVGNNFGLIGSILYYHVTAVYPPGTPGNQTADRWELDVQEIIAEAASAAAAYSLDIDVYGATGMVVPTSRMTRILQMLKRNFDIIDSKVGQVGGSFQKATVSDVAADVASTQSKAIHSVRLTIQTGAAPYTHRFSLPAAGRAQGDRCNIKFDLSGAGVNPKLQIFNNNTAGTKLFEFTHDGLVKAIQAALVLDDTNAWYLEGANFMQ